MNFFLPTPVFEAPFSEGVPSISTPYVLAFTTPALPSPAKKQERRVSEPTWKSAVKKNYQAILGLSAGWDGYRAAKISASVIGHADLILRDALSGQNEAVAPYIIPAADGSVQIEWNNESFEFEFNLTPNSQYSALVRDRKTGQEIEREGTEAINLLFRWAPRLAAAADNVSNVQASEAVRPDYAAA